MTTNSPPYVPIPHLQYTFVQNPQTQTLGGRDHERRLNEHPPGFDFAGPYQPYPAVDNANALSPTTYTSAMRNEDPPQAHVGDVTIGLGHRRLDVDHPTPGITQYIPMDAGPRPFEQHASAIPEVPNNNPAGNIPLPHNVAGPSRGDMNLHCGTSVTETLKKSLAGYYLHNPGSRVSDLRTRRSRSGAVKVLILLEIEDDM